MDQPIQLLTSKNFTNKNLKPKRSRRRITKACLSCRGRKIKCDERKPICSACSLRGIKECIYETPGAESNVAHDELSRYRLEVQRLKQVISDLKQNKVKDFDQDDMLDLRKLTCLLNHRGNLSYYGATSLRAPLELFRSSFMTHLGESKLLLERNRKSTESLNRLNYFAKLSIPKELGALLKHLRMFLPVNGIINKILEEFFNSFWFKLYPIIDQKSFMEDYVRLFVHNQDQFPELTQNDDFAKIAVILLVIKLELAFQYGGVDDTDSHIFVDNEDILSIYISKFLELLDYLSNYSIVILQVIFLLKSINRLKHKTEGRVLDLSIHLGLDVKMALSLGLNNNIDELYKNETTGVKKALKSLWVSIMYHETLDCFEKGTVPSISDLSFHFENVSKKQLICRTSLAFREVLKSVNGPCVTHGSLKRAVSDLHSFIKGNFRPLYSVINQLKDSAVPDFTLIEEFLFHVQALAFISTLQYITLISSQDDSVKDVSFTMCIKTGLLGILSLVDILPILDDLNKNSSTSYSKNQYSVIIISMGRQPLTRISILMLSFVIAEMNEISKDYYKPYSHDIESLNKIPPLLINISDWQNLNYDHKIDPLIFRDLASINNLLIQLYHKIFYEKKKERNYIDDEDLLFKYSWVRFVDNVLTNNVLLSIKANKWKTEFVINNDVTSPIFIEQSAESQIKKDLENIFGWTQNDDNAFSSLFYDDQFIKDLLDESIFNVEDIPI